MSRWRRTAATIVAALATFASAAAPASPINVDAIRVRFRAASAANDVLDLRLSFAPGVAPAFDPAHDDVTLDVGSADSFRVRPDVAARARVRGQVVTYRRARVVGVAAPSPFRRLAIDFRRGRIRAVVDRAGVFAFRQDGAWVVPVTLRIGAATFATSVDFGVSRGGASWRAPARLDRTVRLVGANGIGLGYDSSSIGDPRTLVVRDDAAWTALWTEHVSDFDPKRAIPAVDFSRDVVVAVFRGGVGVDLTIDGFETKSDRIVTHFTVTQYGPHCLISFDIEHLYAFALLPRTDLPVEFDEREVVVDCLR